MTIGVPPEAQILQLKNGQADVSFDATVLRQRGRRALADDPATAERFSSTPSLTLVYLTLNGDAAAARRPHGAPGRSTTPSTARRW